MTEDEITPAMPKREQVSVVTMNPVVTATAVTAAVSALLLALAQWGIDAIPTSVPITVVSSLVGVVIVVLALVAGAIGRYAQRWTFPQVVHQQMVDLGAEALPLIPGATKPVIPQLGDVADIPPEGR